MSRNRTASSYGYGGLISLVKDRAYWSRSGMLYTTTSALLPMTTRFQAVIVLTPRGGPFRIQTATTNHVYQAAAIRPLVCRRMASRTPLVTVQVSPSERHFRLFRNIPEPGYIPMPRKAFAHLDDGLDAAYWGYLNVNESEDLIQRIIATTVRFLPRAGAADRRIERAIETLETHPQYSLRELAASIDLSYYRMSHFFADEIGLPLRTFLLGKKVESVLSFLGSRAPLSEVAQRSGFVDTAHMSRIIRRIYGAPPSYFFSGEFVEVRSTTQPGRH